MGETDAATLGDQHPGVLRLDNRRRCFSAPGQRTAQCRDCRARQQRGHQDRLPRRGRERIDPLHRQFGHARRHRQWPARACVAGEASCDLKRIKGIAARCIGDPREHRPRDRRSQPFADHLAQRRQRQRADGKALKPFLRQCPVQAKRHVGDALAPPGH